MLYVDTGKHSRNGNTQLLMKMAGAVELIGYLKMKLANLYLIHMPLEIEETIYE